jgi:hypothetical protein
MVRFISVRTKEIVLAAVSVGAILLSFSAGYPRTAQARRDTTPTETPKRRLTVNDVIETTQVLNDSGSDPALVSPDRKRYVILLQRGDLKRNGSWVQLLSGSTQSLDAASKPDVVAKLFSASTAQTSDLAKHLRWLHDSEHVAFLWDDGSQPPRVISVDVRTHELRTLVHHPTPILSYDISEDGRTVIFAAEKEHDPSVSRAMVDQGFAVSKQHIYSLLRRDFDGWGPWLGYEIFVSYGSRSRSRKVVQPEHLWGSKPDILQLSPDGLYAIMVRTASKVPTDWDKYTDPYLKNIELAPARRNSESPNLVRQYFVVDIQSGTARPLWEAPENPVGRVVWSPDSRNIVVGPTFLPIGRADVSGLYGLAAAAVDISSGKFVQIELPSSETEGDYRARQWRPVSWNRGNVIEFEQRKDDTVRLRFQRVGQEWRSVLKDKNIGEGESPSPVQIKLRQDPNTPPALYAVQSASGQERFIQDLDPQLRGSITLGRVELVHWTATDGKPWSGILYYPVQDEPGQRFPLVIQTHGYSEKNFSLNGPFTTSFAAQPLANRNIAVLQTGDPDVISGRSITGTPEEPRVYTAGYEGAIEHFTRYGLADPKKIGIIGFSRTGWLVEYMLTHSDASLAAAEVADNIDASYLQYLLSDDEDRTFDDVSKGAAPFGNGLQTWIREAPGFNADKIRVPLRMELDSGPALWGVLSHWEIFSNLRYLRKPVEVFAIPNIEHGAHILQNPAQRLASQGGTVDWFCFWLKGEEDPDPAKSEQYTRWRELRKLQEENDAKATGAAVD